MESVKNIVIEGCTGIGRTYLACCLARAACNKRKSARYIRLPDLLMERDELAKDERTDTKILAKYARYELLLIDEWMAEPLNDTDIHFLFELIERRYLRKSTVICSQYPPQDWHAMCGGQAVADGMLDRILQGAIRIDLGDVNVRSMLSSGAE